MKKKFYGLIVFLFIYTLVYNITFTSFNEIIQYILNPVLWMFFALISYVLLNKNKLYKHETTIKYIIISSALLHIISFYVIGIFVGFTNNPYSVTKTTIIINFFSILLVIGLKEFIRNIYIKLSNSKLQFIIIFSLFFLSDINLLNIINSYNNISLIPELLISDIIPGVVINLFMMYICYRGNYKSAIYYRVIVNLPLLIFPIFPDYNDIILTLFKVLFPLFTYLIIENKIEKQERKVPVRISNQFTPIKWVATFLISIILVIFLLGIFPIFPTVILSKSMYPNIKPGDMVIIRKCGFNEIYIEDIIQYNFNNYKIIHRIIKIDYINNEVITKGDNNNNIDKYPIKREQIIGKVEFKIPFIGYPTYIFRKIIGRNNKNIRFGV